MSDTVTVQITIGSKAAAETFASECGGRVERAGLLRWRVVIDNLTRTQGDAVYQAASEFADSTEEA